MLRPRRLCHRFGLGDRAAAAPKSPRHATSNAHAARSIGNRASAPASRASCSCRALIACMLFSSHRTLAGMVASQPQRKFCWLGDASSANASVARLKRGRAAGRSFRDRGGQAVEQQIGRPKRRGRPRCRSGGTRYVEEVAAGGQATGEQRRAPGVEIGLAREFHVEPLQTSAAFRSSGGAVDPMLDANAIRPTE